MSGDGVPRMPTDGYAFREIQEKWLHFMNEPCNFRFSLETDSVNPFGELRSIYSVWRIFVINNNPPPCMSIKSEHILLTIIIPSIYLH